MGKPELIAELESEAAFTAAAGSAARALLEAQVWPLVIGLRGDLGSGKTTWARAMLRGLGYAGRVPSPTYTLLEQYSWGGITIVHLDLYRLGGDEELENLGLRDWLAEPKGWIIVEWPERAPQLAAHCDLTLVFEVLAAGGRRVLGETRSAIGIEALKLVRQGSFNNGS